MVTARMAATRCPVVNPLDYAFKMYYALKSILHDTCNCMRYRQQLSEKNKEIKSIY